METFDWDESRFYWDLFRDTGDSLAYLLYAEARQREREEREDAGREGPLGRSVHG